MRTNRYALALLIVSALHIVGLPISGRAATLTGEQKKAVAERLNKEFTRVEITAVDAPVIKGDTNPAIFKIIPKGKQGFGKLFESERYHIIVKPDDTSALGNDLCYYVQLFVENKQRERAGRFVKYVPSVKVTIKAVTFEISEDGEAIKDIFYAIVSLAGELDENDYTNFQIFTRGFADAQQRPFRRQLLPSHPYNVVAGLPPVSGDTLKTVYVRPEQPLTTIKNGEYRNDDLPNLRGRFMKEVVDRFLSTCQGTGQPLRTAVLDGSVVDAKQSDFRTMEIFFYAHGP